MDWTPLHIAAFKGSDPIVRELMARGARHDITDKVRCSSDDGWGCCRNQVGQLQEISKGLGAQTAIRAGGHFDLSGASFSAAVQPRHLLLYPSQEGRTALHLAALNGFSAVVTDLLRRGASPAARDKVRAAGC